MYSPSRKVRASVRRTLYLLLIGFIGSLLLVDTVVEIGRSSKETEYPPTRSAGLMLNRSQMLLAKDILLEPTLFNCQPKPNNNSTFMYPIIIAVKAGAVGSGDYFQRRVFTRTSWAKDARSYEIPVIYAVGRAKDEDTQKMLEDEHKTYGDLLQFNFIDAYYNISIKTTGILSWFAKRDCQNTTPYLLIVDDDVLVNMPSLLQLLANYSFDSNTLYGLQLNETEPHPSGKWAVSLDDYPKPMFPPFVTGVSTLYPSSVVNKIVQKIFDLVEANTPMIFLDDVLVTGIIAEQLGIKRAYMPGVSNCSSTSLITQTVISECDKIRRPYIWWKYIFMRLQQNLYDIDRLINTTIAPIWDPKFKQMRNGTALFPRRKFENSLLIILSDYHTKFSFVILFIVFIVFVFIFIPKLVLYKQSTNKSTLLPTSIPTSTGSDSLKLLAPTK